MGEESNQEQRYQEKFSREEKAMAKQGRKIATAKDRSKFKKTDRKMVQKAEAPVSQEHLLRGRVLSIMSQGIIVEHDSGTFACILRGIIKKEKNQQKNLVAVGDFVLFEKTHEAEGVIAYIEPRRSVLSRADNLSRRKEQLIATNIDQVLITLSVVRPPMKQSIVDRYIIATRKGNMEPVIVINKMDLLDNEAYPQEFREAEREICEQFVAAYRQAGIPVICMSATTGEGLDDLCAVMRDKASVFSGQSGVGKSSLINSVSGYDLRVGEIVEKTKKGSHTTTTAQLLKLKFGGYCIDTPGIKSFGLWQLTREEIEKYFPDIHEVGLNCKYQDCRHLHEQDCAVLEAIDREELSFMRYESYQFLIESLDQEHKNR